MSTFEENTPGILGFRIGRAEKRLERLDEWRMSVDNDRTVTGEQIKFIRDEVKELREGFDGLRRTLVGFSITIAVAALTFALSILAATGRI